MLVLDVNVLVYAFRTDADGHASYRRWLESTLAGDDPVALAPVVLSGFLRVVTHPRIWREPSPIEEALEYADALRRAPSAVELAPSDAHWPLFSRLCRSIHASGNAIPDAFIAALAMDARAELITTEGGFGRFRGLRWRHPLGREEG